MAAAAQTQDTVIWRAQPGPQTSLLTCPADDVGYGGARGGGKSDGILGEWLRHEATYAEHAIGLCFRRERTQLTELVERAKQIYLPLGFKWHEQDKYFRSPKGSRLRFAYLESNSDADAYQGHSYTRVYGEELGTFPIEAPINKLMATLRSGHGVPCGFRSTFNPGGPGHQWVKARYIDPAPQGYEILRYEFVNPFTREKIVKTRVFIPAKVTDNHYLGGDYVANLQMVGSEQLVRAWLEGDWNVIEGAFFDCWSPNLVIEPFEIPRDWLRFRSFDWGSARPFSVGWWAVVGDTGHPGGLLRTLPRGAIVRYREWYGASAPNTGLKLDAEEVAQGIAKRDGQDKIGYSVADPSIFSQDGGPSLAERMLKEGIAFRPADNKRVGKLGAMGGWDQMRARMKGEDDRPMVYCFNTCKDSIRTIPSLQHDSNRPEDLDTEGEDHAADEWRYACMSRPWVPAQVIVKPKPQIIVGGTTTVTMDELWKARDQEKSGRV